MSQAVNSRRVNPVDAPVNGCVDGRDRICIVLRPPGERPPAAAERPRAKANPRDLHIRVAKLSCLHCPILKVNVEINNKSGAAPYNESSGQGYGVEALIFAGN